MILINDVRAQYLTLESVIKHILDISLSEVDILKWMTQIVVIPNFVLNQIFSLF